MRPRAVVAEEWWWICSSPAKFASGSTQGIGRAIAEALLVEGAAVVVNGRDTTRVEGTVATLAAAVPGGDVSGIAADFTEPEQVQGLLEELGDVDVLVNNVGRFGVGAFTDATDADWLHYVEVNLMSGVRLSRHLLPGKTSLIAQRSTSLLGRFIEPAEIADLVAYLASPRPAATNGAALRADGGVLTGVL